MDSSHTQRAIKAANSFGLVGLNEILPGILSKQTSSETNIQGSNPDRPQVDAGSHRHPLRPISGVKHQQPPYHINIMLKNYGETCFRCKRKIQIVSEHRPNNNEQDKYCRGCQPNTEEPIGLNLDLRKVCFTVDWTRDFSY